MIVLVHGGFWRFPYTRLLMRGLAASVTEQGWVAWNIEYRRADPIGRAAPWPHTLLDVANAIDHLAELPGLDLNRVVTVGHSAGGQLGLWAAARHRLTASGWPEPKVTVASAVALAGVVDLERADELGLGNDAVAHFVGGHRGEHPERYAEASPAALLPLGVPQVLVHGVDDTVVPPVMSEAYCRSARAAGDEAEHVALPGVGHRELIDARGGAWATTLGHLERLLS